MARDVGASPVSETEPRVVYDKDGIVLYCGDCRDVLPTLAQVDHVITDPPYWVDVYMRMRSADSAGGNRRLSIKSGSALVAMKNGDIGMLDADLIGLVSAEWARLATRWILVFSDAESTHRWRQGLLDGGARYVRTGAWMKPDGMPQMTGDRPGVGFELCTIAHAQGAMQWNGGGHAAVWTHNIVKGDARADHPCPKPIGLMLELVELFTDPGETILDPFAGSGTTLVAAKQLGRKAIGIEISEEYCRVAIKRLEATTPPLFVMKAEPPKQEAML